MILGMIAVISGLAEIDRVTSIYLCVGKLAAHNLGCSPFLAMRASLVGWTVIMAAGNTRVELVAHWPLYSCARYITGVSVPCLQPIRIYRDF